jgi:hypothetical protein
MILPGVEIPTGVHGGEQSVDRVDAWRRDVLLQPGRVLGADSVMVRQRTARVDERLLDDVLDSLILSNRVDAVMLEAEGEVQAGA